MLQSALENTGNRDDDLLHEAVDKHRRDDLSNHRKGVNQHLGNTGQRAQRSERNRRDDVQRVLDRTSEHAECISQAKNDEAQERHSTVRPVQPAHTSRTHEVHRVVVLAGRRRHRMSRRIDRCRVLAESRIQVVIHRQRRQIRIVEVITKHHPVTGKLSIVRRKRHNPASLGTVSLETSALLNLQNRVIRSLDSRARLTIGLRRTIRLDVEPRRRTVLHRLLATRCLLADATLDRRIEVRCLIRLSVRVSQQHIHRRHERQILQTTVRCHIRLGRLGGNRTKVRWLDTRHIRESAWVSNPVNCNSRLTQLIHRCTGRSLLGIVPFKRGVTRNRQTIHLGPVLEIHESRQNDTSRTHTGTRRRILHNAQRCRVHRTNEGYTYTEEQHTDDQLLQATQRIAFLPHERRDDEREQKQRDQHSPRQVHKRLIPTAEPRIKTLHPHRHTLSTSHTVGHCSARCRNCREEELERVERLQQPDHSRENRIDTTSEQIQQGHDATKRHVLEVKPQTRRRGIKTQRVQQRAILSIVKNASVDGVRTT